MGRPARNTCYKTPENKGAEAELGKKKVFSMNLPGPV